MVLGYEEELESRISPLFLHQTAEQVSVSLSKGRTRRGVPCLCGKTLNYAQVCCVEVTVYLGEYVK